MHKGVALLIGCFSLLLGLVLMDVSYTGHAVFDIDTTIYEGSNFAIALSLTVGMLVVIGVLYHHINKPLHEDLERQRIHRS